MQRITSRAWYIKFPNDFYALGPMRFEKPIGERKVREAVRKWDKLTRLPVGFQCWPAEK